MKRIVGPAAVVLVPSFLILAALLLSSNSAPPDRQETAQPAIASTTTASHEVSGMPAEHTILSFSPGFDTFTLRSAAEAELRDDEAIIGVVVSGEPRAYLVSALGAGPDQHVVNDSIAGAPITVTYCDRTDVARVLTDDSREGALDVAIAGLRNGRLLLYVNGRPCLQESTEFPLADYAYERKAWASWRAEHPDTKVYVGGGSKDYGAEAKQKRGATP
jgi:hypothetical protein